MRRPRRRSRPPCPASSLPSSPPHAASGAATGFVVAVSAAVFSGVSTASAAPSPRTPTPSSMWMVTNLLHRRLTMSFEDYCNKEEQKSAMGRVHGLEECIDAAESGCEEVYRALVNASVSLSPTSMLPVRTSSLSLATSVKIKRKEMEEFQAVSGWFEA
uniref:Uncharacterized protein n=1 Tax=Arundo donax TaxID=35708 RepID=A0A0A9FC54_ARUDO